MQRRRAIAPLFCLLAGIVLTTTGCVAPPGYVPPPALSVHLGATESCSPVSQPCCEPVACGCQPAISSVSQVVYTTSTTCPDCPHDSRQNFARPVSTGPLSAGDQVKEDFGNLWPWFKEDAAGLATKENAVILSVALAAAVGIHQDWDDNVRDYVAEHPRRWGNGTSVLGAFGDPLVQVPVLLSLYGYTVAEQDPELHQLSTTLIRTAILTGVSTVAVKGIANTDRPSKRWNNGKFGFPSGHVSSMFAYSAVLDDYYGAEVGIPMYALSTLVGWSRIDDRDHDVSDVVFGAALGYVIGKTVSRQAFGNDSPVEMLPYVHPTEAASGIQFGINY